MRIRIMVAAVEIPAYKSAYLAEISRAIFAGRGAAILTPTIIDQFNALEESCDWMKHAATG